MTRKEIIKQLTRIHDWMTDNQGRPDEKKAVQALCEGIGWMEEADLNEIGRMRIMFLCDGRACLEGCNRRADGRCKHVMNPLHAKNFILQGNGLLIESENRAEMPIQISYNDVIVEV